MTEAMAVYGMVFAKLAIGLLAIILQINLMGKGNLAPTSALDQLQTTYLVVLSVPLFTMTKLVFYSLC